MILITILALIVLLLGITLVGAVAATGTGIIIIFGDVIVCAIFIVLLIKYLIKRKKK